MQRKSSYANHLLVSAVFTFVFSTAVYCYESGGVDLRAMAAYVVTNTNDSGPGSLRQAILDANTTPGTDNITFSIPGPGPHTIQPLTALPTITDPVVVDGITQSGAQCNSVAAPGVSDAILLIELDGSLAGAAANGLTINAGSCTVRGLVINNFNQNGIALLTAGNNIIECNYIGTDTSGTIDRGNGENGVDLENGADNTLIGGIIPQARNLISGNDDDGIAANDVANLTVQGNFVGTDFTGTLDLGNNLDGMDLINCSFATIGGTIAAARNLVSGNNDDGINIDATNNSIIQGNMVGLDINGTTAIGNTGDGILIELSSVDNTVGGSGAGARNVISANGSDGLELLDAGTSNNSILGNFIGTDISGTLAFGNSNDGVRIEGASGNFIGGTNNGEGNLISGNDDDGVQIIGDGSNNNFVQGNFIGTDINGTADLGNAADGIVISSGIISGNLIGGATANSGNLISGNNQTGISLVDPNVSNNTVQGNLIGTDITGTSSLGNPVGIEIGDGAFDNLIGGTTTAEGNTVAFNTSSGVVLQSNAGSDNTIISNSIHTNGALGIDLGNNAVTINDIGDGDSGPNDLLNFPVITSITQVGPDMNVDFVLDVPSGNYRVEFFDNPSGVDPSGYGEGEIFLDFTTVAASPGSTHSITLSGVAPNNVLEVTTTATEDLGGSYGSTSEFSSPTATPVALDDIYNTNEDTPLSDDVLANDSDPNGDPLTVSLITDVSNGALVLNSDGTFTYTPASNYNGADSFVYEVCDDAIPTNNCAQATVSITINPINDAPLAGDDPGETTNEDIPLINTVLVNDSDPDGDPLTIVSLTQPVNGTVVNNGNGTITYTPFPNFSGVNTYTYTITDGNGATASATVTITVNPINDAPEAVLDIVATLEEVPVVVSMLSNDLDVDGDPINLTGFTQGTNGVVIDNGNGTFTYTPNTNFFGIDNFSYTISDGNGGFDTGTVTVVVASINDGPQAVDDNANTNEDTPVVINVTSNDLDLEGDPLTVVIVTQGISGSVAISSSSTVTYTPFPNFHGSDTFTYTVTDGNGGISTATVSVLVDPINDDPVAVDDLESIPEDTPVTIDVIANDIDIDGDLLAIVAVTSASNGTLINNGDGTISYSPNANYNGTDTFTYTISDGNGGFSIGTVTIFVGPINDDPIANDDFDITKEDIAVSTNVLANDSDPPDNDPLIVTYVMQPSNGSVINNGDGTITYTPNLNFNGTDTYTYSITDGRGGVAIATVTIIVQSVNDHPTAVLDIMATAEDVAVIIPVLDNDFDIDGDAIRVQRVGKAANGSVVNNHDGTVTYTPDNNFTGVDTFTYTITDNRGGFSTAVVSVYVGIINDAPLATDDIVNTFEDTPATTDVLANDTDPDGDVLTIVVVTQGSNGTVVDNGNGTITYNPNTNFTGTDTYTYTITDGNGGVSTATVSVVVNPSNDDPVAVVDIDGTNEDTPVTTDVLANDYDPEGASVSVVSTTQGLNGTVVDNGDGTVTYTPNPDFNGVDTYTYTITDGSGGTATATVSIFVDPLNDPPVAEDDVSNTLVNTQVMVAVLNNDFDVDGDALSILLVGTANNGSVVDNGDGTVSYNPNIGFLGIDSFTYTITDGNGTTASATVVVFVGINNNPPVANDDNDSTDEDNAVTSNVLVNDSDADSDPLTIITLTQPSNGIATDNGNGTITYTPNPNYNGIDSYTYTVTDNRGGVATATVNITVNPINDAPVAVDDFQNTDEEVAIIISVLNNDTDVDGDVLSIAGFSSAANGTVVDNGNGTLTYSPASEFSGTDTFTYTVSDGNGGTDGATVTIVVAAINDDPIAQDDSDITNEDNPITTDVLSNDSDPENDPISVFSVTQGTNGTVTNNGDGTITYTPDPDYFGIDTYTYVIADGQGGSATATVSITVNPLNDPPEAVDDNGTTDEDTAVIIDILGNDLDIDGTIDLNSITVTNPPTNGSFTDNGNGTITYTPNSGFNGLDSLTYTVNDNDGAASNIAVVIINVIDINDPPVAVDDGANTDEELAVIINVINNDTDSDGTIDPATIGIASFPLRGQITVNGDGTITYTPDPNFAGIDSLTYTVDDDDGTTSNVATVVITVINVNDPPVAIDESYVTDEDTPLSIIAPGLLGNDLDIDGDALLVTVFDNMSSAGGTVTVGSDGSISYTPPLNFNGSDTFTYTVSDGNGGTDLGMVTITVNPINDNPLAVDDNYSTNQDTPLNLSAPGVLGNDNDVEGDPIFVSAFDSNTANGGLVSVNPDGSFNYTPPGGYTGVDTFTYIIDDGNSGLDTATVSITVIDVNDPPQPQDDSYGVDEDLILTVTDPALGLLTNDSDPENNTLTVSTTPVSGPSNGSLVLNPDGTFTYTPGPNYNGSDSFIYEVCDDGIPSACNQASVIININPQPDAPIAVNDSLTAMQDVPLNITAPGLLANDFDVDGDNLTVTNVVEIATSGGLITWNANGSIVYTPPSGFQGTEVFQYTIDDGNGGIDSALITIVVLIPNRPPIAVNDTLSTEEDLPVSGNIMLNDSDPDGDNIMVTTTAISGPSNGMVFLNTDGTFTYTPNAGFSGTDSFIYEICDDALVSRCAQAAVIIEVIPFDGIVIYEGVSPNNDGSNDIWTIQGIERFPNNRVQIFNRWGHKIYQAQGYNNATIFWEGQSTEGFILGNEIVPDGTYFYVLDLGDGSKKYSGYIVLKK